MLLLDDRPLMLNDGRLAVVPGAMAIGASPARWGLTNIKRYST
jgi:hypothetical protein